MQEIIDKIISSVEKTTKVVVQKSNDVVESTKIRYAIISDEGKASDIAREIGQLVYDAYKSGTGNPEQIEQKCADLDVLHDEIEDKKNQLARLRNMKRCTDCGHANDMQAAYCNRCGSKLPEVEVQEVDDMPHGSEGSDEVVDAEAGETASNDGGNM